jgi:hypothetical protein
MGRMVYLLLAHARYLAPPTAYADKFVCALVSQFHTERLPSLGQFFLVFSETKESRLKNLSIPFCTFHEYEMSYIVGKLYIDCKIYLQNYQYRSPTVSRKPTENLLCIPLSTYK